jgi:hypothetical protein
MNLRATILKLGRFLRSRLPELSLFLLGALLRVTMRTSYDVTWAFDASDHWDVVRWMAEHGRIPAVDALRESFHPPLYYAAAAWLFRLGVSRANIVWVSIVCGVLRLGVLWAGLELYLPKSRVARAAALALAAVLPAAVHVDGMAYAEPMSGLWLTAALLVVPLVYRRAPDRRWRLAAGLGLILGIALLTKISAVAILLSIGAGASLEFAFSSREPKSRGRDAMPWAATFAVCFAMTGWYFARNVRDYGKPFVASFDTPQEHVVVADTQKTPYLDRRSLGYVVGWDRAMYAFPYRPSTIGVHPRFFPTAVASTFVDFWNYSFSGIDPSTKSPIWAGFRPISAEVLVASQYAIVGGSVISFSTAIAWLVVARMTFRQRDWGPFTLLLAPAVMLALALHFAIEYPIDHYGVVKGAYLQFAAGPLFGVFGLAVAWSLRKPMRWPIFAALFAATWLVAAYTLYCRLRLCILPLGWTPWWI